jgi:hypothetical protein
MRAKSENALAALTLVTAFVHLVLETYFHFRWGQPLSFLLVDYVSVSLMLCAAGVSLRVRPRSAAGMLAGAWGFAFCLAYRSTFDRVEQLRAGASPENGEPIAILVILAPVLAIAGVVFAWAFWLAYAQTRQS